MSGDSNALALGLKVDNPKRKFNWGSFTNSITRLEAYPGTMLTATAAKFDGQNYLGVDEAPFLDYPITLFSWWRTTVNATQGLVWVGLSSSGTRYQTLYITGAQVNFQTRDSAANKTAFENTGDPDDGNWHFGAGVSTTANRFAYFDGNVGTAETTSIPITVTYDRVNLGRWGDQSPDFWLIGDQQHAGIYLGAMTTAQLDWLYNSGAGRNWADVANNSVSLDPDLFSCWWPLDEESGTRSNSGAGFGGNDIDLSGAGNAAGLTFASADSEFAENTTAAVTAYPLSMGGCFKCVVATTSVMMAIGQDGANEYQALWTAADGTLSAVSRSAADGTLQASTVSAGYDDDAWHFIGGTWASATSRKIYVDAVAAVEETTSVTIGGAYDRTTMAKHAIADSGHFDGELDNWWIFSVALSDAQMSWMQSGGTGGKPVLYADVLLSTNANNPGVRNLVAWYTLNEDTGATTLVNIHNPGTLDLTTSTLGTGPTTATGNVTDLPIPTDGTVTRVPVTGETISQWTDQTANANSETQATWRKRPRLIADTTVASGYAVRTDAEDDYLSTSAWTALSQPNTIILAVKARDTTVNQGLCDGIAAANEASIQVNATGDVVTVDAGTADDSAFDIDYTNLHILTVVINGASTVLYQDGGTGETLSAGAETQTGLTLGALFDGSLPADADFYFALVNNGALTNSQLDSIHVSLGGLLGVSVTPVA